jgi:hypothetical protein
MLLTTLGHDDNGKEKDDFFVHILGIGVKPYRFLKAIRFEYSKNTK